MDSTTQVLQTLYTTFFVWFLSWTLIETTLSYYKISLTTKLKVVFVLWVIAVTYYVKYNQGSRDETVVSE